MYPQEHGVCAPTVFISRFLVWRCGVLVVMTRRIFWHIYRQRYVKTLRNRPFSPQIIRENLWLALKPQISQITQFFYKDFSATNSHKFPQTILLLNLAESAWVPHTGPTRRICTPNVKSHRGLRQFLEAYSIRFSHLFYPFKPNLHPILKKATGQRAIGYGGLKNNN